MRASELINRHVLRSIVVVVVSVLLPSMANAAAKHALVIGNSAYEDRPLQNPRNDAVDMAQALEGLGYRIAGGAAQLDLDAESFDAVLTDFTTNLNNGDTAVFYFAGHGASTRGQNYLIPTGQRITNATQLRHRSLSLQYIVDSLKDVNPDGFNALFVDACRDNPFGRSYRTNSRGLTRVEAVPAGVFIGLAAGAGQVAADNDASGRNGLYTGALLAELRRSPGRGIESLHKAVAREVYNQSRNSDNPQRPTYHTDLLRDWCIGPCDDGGDVSVDSDVSRLTVKTEPAGARVRIMNIGPAYEAGMALARGERYDIYVTAEGYVAERAWHTLSEPEEVIGVVLQRERAPTPQPEPATRAWFEPETVEIPGGRFQMGCLNDDGECDDDEKPVRSVSVPGFRLGRYEVTRGQFAAFVDWSGYETEAERNIGGDGCRGWNGKEWEWDGKRNWRNPGFEQTDDHPVVCVSWNDAQAYIGWLNERTGKRYRLPSEAEWEYATRGGTRSKYYFGDDASDLCTYGNVRDKTLQQTLGWEGIADCSDGAVHTAEVGSYKPTWRGVHDLHGNVWEWLEDRYHESYAGAPTDGSAWTEGETGSRVLRGGAWADEPRFLRSAFRGRVVAANRLILVGIRLAEDRAR